MSLEKEKINSLVAAIDSVANGEHIKPLNGSFKNSSLKELAAKVNELAKRIKAQKLAQARLEKEQHKKVKELESILYKIPSGIVVIDSETHEILQVNKMAQVFIGHPRESIIGKKCQQFICTSQMGTCPVKDQGISIDNRECSILNHHGDEIPVTKTVLKTLINGRPCFLETFVDITKMKVTEDRLKSSQVRFKELFSHINSGVSVYKAIDDGNDFECTDFNQAAERIEQIAKEEVIGKRVTEVFPGIHQFGILDIFRKVYKTGDPHDHPVTFYKDERIKGWRKNHVYKLPTNEIVSVFTDMTAQMEMEQELRESEERFRSITANAQDGIIMTDIEGRIHYWNEAAERIFGYDPDEMIGKKWHVALAPKKYRREYQVMFRRFLSRGKGLESGKTVELIGNHKDGRDVPLSLSFSAVKVKDEWTGIGILRDITKQKDDEKHLKKAIEDAENANRTKSVFLANMSHEIRTPMNAILGFAEILESKLEDPQLQHYLQLISSSGKALLGLINDILDLSKIEAGKMELQYKAVNPHSLMNEISQIFSWKAKQKNIDFITEIDPGIPQALVLDDVRLRQIITNLIGNAVKFTDTGHIRLTVSKEFRKGDHARMDIHIAVEDTGIGISDSQQELIFDAFKQSSGQDNGKYGGTGLGLAITKSLVDMMNGSISVQSEKGKGTVFSVHLANVSVASISEEPETDLQDISDIVFEPAKILVVDDIKDNRLLVRSFLESFDFELIEAENGEEAVEKAWSHHPDLVLMDLKMPIMDGYTATETIKNDPDTKDIVVVALTASAMKNEEPRIYKVGCQGYLRKPISKSELVREMIRFLSYHKNDESGAKANSDAKLDKALKLDDLPKTVVDSLPDLIAMLRNGSMEKYKNAKKTFMMNQITDFANEVVELGKSYRLSFLEEWATTVLKQAQSFDMESLPGNLSRFESILDEIESCIE